VLIIPANTPDGVPVKPEMTEKHVRLDFLICQVSRPAPGKSDPFLLQIVTHQFQMTTGKNPPVLNEKFINGLSNVMHYATSRAGVDADASREWFSVLVTVFMPFPFTHPDGPGLALFIGSTPLAVLWTHAPSERLHGTVPSITLAEI
jgi:hypothetical protein